MAPALGEHRTFLTDGELPSFPKDYLVSDATENPIQLTVTLAGDCTIGGTEQGNRQATGLTQKVLNKGLDYPFSGLLPLFSQDDLTIVNLEGVLSDDSKGENKEKNFAFRGPAALSGALPLGSVEAVNLANNHTQDYGETGLANTLKTLDGQGIAYAGNEWLCVFQAKDMKIGLAGITGSLTQAKKDLIIKQIALLQEAGCQVIIYSLHAGQEYVKKHNSAQRNMARFLIDAGADAVAGHHPHVVQGIEIYKGRPIFYSLGNCVFGGNSHPKERGALAVSITFSLEQGKIKGIQTSLYPIYITGSGRINDYRPQLLTGKQADAVIKQVQQDTAFTLPPYREGEGAQLALIPPEQ